MALLTTVILLFAAEGDSLASWHLRCCHGNSRGARQLLLLRQQAELQSQVRSSPAPRARPQVPSSWVGPPQPRPPHQVLTLQSPPTCTGSLSHPGEPCPSWAGPPASCWPPGPPWADPSPPQLRHAEQGAELGRAGAGGDAAIGQAAQRKCMCRGLGLPAFKDPLQAQPRPSPGEGAPRA